MNEKKEKILKKLNLLPNSSGSSLTSWIDPALVELDKDKVETALISVKLPKNLPTPEH
jgi:hypothetical protein